MQLSVSKTSSARADAEFDDDSGMFDVARRYRCGWKIIAS